MSSHSFISGLAVIMAASLFTAVSAAPSDKVAQAAPPKVVAPAPMAAMMEMRVAFTKDGFAPASVTIKKGGKVIFTNNSDMEVKVVSGPQDLPALSQKASMKKGESFSFTFDKVGTFSYHNDLKPEQSGKVIVVQ